MFDKAKTVLAELLNCGELDVENLAQKMIDFSVEVEDLDFFNKDVNTLLEDVFMIAIENHGFYYSQLLDKGIVYAHCNSLDTKFYIYDEQVLNVSEMCKELNKINKIVNGLI